MAEIPEPTVQATRYEVSCVPDDDLNAHSWTIAVEYCGDGLWAVRRNGASYDADGGRSRGVQWEDGREPIGEAEMDSYERARQAWLDAHRFDEQTALSIAREAAKRITIRDWTVADALAARLAEGDGRG